MLISIHDKALRRVAFIDNEKPETLHFFDDIWHRYLTEATSTFDFSVPKTGDAALRCLTEKSYVSFRHEGKDYLFNIMRTEETDFELTCFCESLSMELLNEDAAPYPASGSKKFVDYFNDASQIGGQDFTDLVIGINEVSEYSRNLEWDGTSTKLARLLSLVRKFDAECEFETRLNRDGSLDKIVLNVYKANDGSHQGVGTHRQDVTLYYGKSIDGVRRTIDKTELYSAIYATGKDGLTVASLNKIEYDEEGRVLYSSPAGNPTIYAPQTAQEYPAQISTNMDPWILYRWEYDTDNVNVLYGQALAMLKKVSVPALTYEIEGALNLNIGDTVTIHDDNFTPTLLLEARVSEQEISFCDPSKNKNIYSNFKALENRLSSDITGRLEELIREATPYVAEILTDNGTVFKNGEGSTTLTARVVRGTTDVTSQMGHRWTRDGVEVSLDEAVTITAAEVHGKALYRLSVINGFEDEVCFAEVTIIDVADGESGAPGIAGADGLGIRTTTITYAGSTSGTAPPTSGWTAQVPSVPEGQFLWTKTIWTYTDNTTETGYSVAKMGDTGATGVGVTAVYRYYCLQVSKPAKPTTLNPGTSWTLVEPTYTEGSTNNLYTTDLVVYSNGAFVYSDVSLSSSYKAAKDAYNKAINAQALANAAKDAAAAADILARAAQTSANSAQTTADGKNTVFYATTAPVTAGRKRKINDIWFDTANGNRMYYWNGSAWTLRQFGTNALAELSITNALIANAAINNAKIANIDAGKITTGIIDADRIGAGSLTVGKLTEAALTEIQKPAAAAQLAADAAASAAAAAQGTANTAKSTADTAKVNAAAAQSTANTAKTNAATAQSAADAAKATLAAWCYNNNLTYIDGGNIYTGTVTAAKIAADAITADKIAAGAITADKFYGTAITSNNYVANSAGMKINLANGTIDTKNFKVDSAGNVAMTGTLTMQGAQTLKICNNSAVEIASLKYESINWNGKTFDSAKLYGKTNVDLAVGSTSNNVECQVRMMAGAYAPIACGQRSNRQTWVSLTGSGGVIGIDPLNSPAVYATGCTKELTLQTSPPLVVGSGYTPVSGRYTGLVYNAMGSLCVVNIAMSGRVAGSSLNIILTIPAGYRPKIQTVFLGLSGTGDVFQCHFKTDGKVTIWDPVGFTGDFYIFGLYYL